MIPAGHCFHNNGSGVVVAILVDEARWPWRGTLWCHLVSDSNLAELHMFAGELGARRVGFQGDHYDIDIDTRAIAIANGATPCESRELIRRMRSAGLRLRPSAFTKWELVRRGDEDDGEPVDVLADPVLTQFLDRMDGWFVLSRLRSTGERATGVVVMGNSADGEVVLPEDDPEVGLYSRVDHLGNWSVERITPAPTDSE